MLRGLDYYVIGHAVSQFPAYFKFRTWIERHEEPEDKKNAGVRLEPERRDEPEQNTNHFENSISIGRNDGSDSNTQRNDNSGGSSSSSSSEQ